jgi:hypothetical protein
MKLEDFKLFELRDIVRKYNKNVKLPGFSSMKKAELISALRSHKRLEVKEGGEKVIINIRPLKNITKIIKPKKDDNKKSKKTKDSEESDKPVPESTKDEGATDTAPKSAIDKRNDRLKFMRKKKAEKKAQMPGKKLKKITKEDIQDLGKEKAKQSKPKIPKIKITDAEPTTYKELDSKEKVEQFKLPKPSVKKIRVAPKKEEKIIKGKQARDAERDRIKKIISKKMMLPLSALRYIKRLDEAEEELERIEKIEKEEAEFEDKYLDGLIRGGPRSKQIEVIEKIFEEYGSRDKETQEGLLEELEKFRINVPKSKQARTDFFDDLSKLEQQLFKLQNSRMYNEFLLPVKKKKDEEKKDKE